MPELTRRRSLDAPDECWHVYYSDVRVWVIPLPRGRLGGSCLENLADDAARKQGA